jgi:hypothetical protein
MHDIKRAQNVQTLCLACSLATSSISPTHQNMTRDMIRAVIDEITGGPITKVLLIGGHLSIYDVINYKLMVYDVEKNEWSVPKNRLPDAGAGGCYWMSVVDRDSIFAMVGYRGAILNASALLSPDAVSSGSLFDVGRDDAFLMSRAGSLVPMPDGSCIFTHVICSREDDATKLRGKNGIGHYDHLTQKWSVVRKGRRTLTCEYSFCVAIDDTHVMLVGGFDQAVWGTETDMCLIYNTRTHKFRVAESMHRARGHLGGCLLWSGEIFVSGGISGGIKTHGSEFPHHLNRRGPYQGECEIYSPTTRKWRLLDGLLMTRHKHTCTQISPIHILIAGGVVGRDSVAADNLVCEIYDLDTETSRVVASLPFHVRDATAMPLSL